jgi:hypothetical protein
VEETCVQGFAGIKAKNTLPATTIHPEEEKTIAIVEFSTTVELITSLITNLLLFISIHFLLSFGRRYQCSLIFQRQTSGEKVFNFT